MLRRLLAELLPRWLAIALGIRRVSPEGGYWPRRSVDVPPIDTGGGFRAAWREQDPAKDPKEPNGGESSSAGNDHGWSNCTCTSGALALAYQQPRGSLAPWGGDLRHKQGDQSGGTDLFDCRDAWKAYGETLTIKSGDGWAQVEKDHSDGQAIVIQGSGNVPGSESFDGGHACCIAPETHSDGRWLFGDPLASGWQWIKPSDIKAWAQRWQSSIAFAVGEAPPPPEPPEPEPGPEPEPEPVPTPVPPRPPLGQYALVVAERQVIEAERDRAVDDWAAWLAAGAPPTSSMYDAGYWGAAAWARGPIPDPVRAAETARITAPQWDGGAWRELLWHG